MIWIALGCVIGGAVLGAALVLVYLRRLFGKGW